jgi:hypothetical protein
VKSSERKFLAGAKNLRSEIWIIIHMHALQRKFHLCIPKKGLRGLSMNFHIHVSVTYLYIPRIGLHIFLQQNRQTDARWWEYINRSQTLNETYTHISKTEFVTTFFDVSISDLNFIFVRKKLFIRLIVLCIPSYAPSFAVCIAIMYSINLARLFPCTPCL